MQQDKKIYFASDFHLGVPDYASSLEREKKIVRWLDTIKHDAEEIYLLGDVFDFWFEYKRVVPRGYVRLLGKIAELTDSGIPIHWFTGNHDMWIFDYVPKELNVIMHRAPIQKEYNGMKFYIAHGDGLGPGDHGYKFIKKVFASTTCQWLFARIHPNLGMRIANYWSGKSRIATGNYEEKYLGDEKEFLVLYSKEILAKEHFDYLIFGHRHLPLDVRIGNSRYVNLGDWVNYFTYAIFDGNDLKQLKFE
ncbi:MAG TPA: UDP-2,3-diacylglucosamine diphosphatase [Bacteroidia bacterium]|nr:UDP-2,3-diacylglucosamine diphosphatase [Bacteroidia bacterium]